MSRSGLLDLLLHRLPGWIVSISPPSSWSQEAVPRVLWDFRKEERPCHLVEFPSFLPALWETWQRTWLLKVQVNLGPTTSWGNTGMLCFQKVSREYDVLRGLNYFNYRKSGKTIWKLWFNKKIVWRKQPHRSLLKWRDIYRILEKVLGSWNDCGCAQIAMWICHLVTEVQVVFWGWSKVSRGLLQLWVAYLICWSCD